MNRRTLFQSLATTAATAALSSGLSNAEATPTRRPDAARRSVVRAMDGCELSHAEWGNDGPTVLMVHSWSMNSGIWRHQVRALTQAGFRVVMFDRRGHGRSQMTGQGYEFDTLADDLGAVVDQLGLSDVTLVGHSMGTAEIVHYLARHGSERVRNIVLLAPTTPFTTKTPDNPAGIDRAVLEASLDSIRSDFPKWAADNSARYFRPTTSPETVEWGVRMLLDTPTPVAVACAEAFMSHDFRPDLAKISVPTLVIHGDADASAPLPITGERTAALIKGARLVVIPGAPHGLYETDAARVNEEIIGFARHT
jgi:non-heme chloroperoxidase